VLQAYKKDISQRQEIEDDELLQGKFETAQRDELEDDELLQGKFETAQREELEDDELLQGKFETTQRQEAPNNTGLPDNLKAGVEQLSGLDMSDVRVHYNSAKPASVQAHAYTQGTDIHVAPGQEKHLGHEAWHVAQQKQGRVQPTTAVGGMAVNDNAGLEREADVMGGKALQMKQEENRSWAVANSVGQKKSNVKQGFGFVDNRPKAIVQRLLHDMVNNFQDFIQLRGNKAAIKNIVNWGGLPGGLQGHLMNARVDAQGRPTGLHAYQNGVLPANAILLERVGSINSVHQIWWTTAVAGNVCKWSTMFPANLTEGMVTTILQSAENAFGGWPKNVECANLGLPYGGAMSIDSVGATRFPSLGITPQSRRPNIQFGNVIYNVHNHN
jgi:hypothetical protein